MIVGTNEGKLLLIENTEVKAVLNASPRNNIGIEAIVETRLGLVVGCGNASVLFLEWNTTSNTTHNNGGVDVVADLLRVVHVIPFPASGTSSISSGSGSSRSSSRFVCFMFTLSFVSGYIYIFIISGYMFIWLYVHLVYLTDVFRYIHTYIFKYDIQIYSTNIFRYSQFQI